VAGSAKLAAQAGDATGAARLVAAAFAIAMVSDITLMHTAEALRQRNLGTAGGQTITAPILQSQRGINTKRSIATSHSCLHAADPA
jgi:hypothetical protein